MLIPLGILSAQAAFAAIQYRLQTLGGASADQGRSIKVASTGEVFALGDTASAGAGSSDSLLVKYNEAGVIQWQRLLGSANVDRMRGVGVDSSANAYIVGADASDGKIIIAKYDNSGTLQWQRILSGAGTESSGGIAVDASGNLYSLGTETTSTGNNRLFLAKYDSSGSIVYQRSLGGAGSAQGWSVALDSSGDVYCSGQTNISGGAGGEDLLLVKFNSSGTIQWQRSLGGANNEAGFGIAVDSSDNVYVTGNTDSEGAGGNDVLLAKYNNLGTLQWQRILGGIGANDRGRALVADSNNNVYLAGGTNSASLGSFAAILAKYDSSGTIQWQRRLGGSGFDEAFGIAVDGQDNVYAIAQTTSAGAGGNDFLLAVVPNDGSLTGTYTLNVTSITYDASSLTAATSTLTDNVRSLTGSTPTLTSSTGTLTSGTASLTEYRVDL
jgi:hypothetical protein